MLRLTNIRTRGFVRGGLPDEKSFTRGGPPDGKSFTRGGLPDGKSFTRGGRPDSAGVRQPFDHTCDTDRKYSVRQQLLVGVHSEMSAEEGPGGCLAGRMGQEGWQY